MRNPPPPEIHPLSLHDALPISAVSTPDRQVSGASVVGERRITGVSWTHDRRAPSSGLRVGGEVEAWCGKCDGLKTQDRKSTRLNSSHVRTSYAVFWVKKKSTAA